MNTSALVTWTVILLVILVGAWYVYSLRAASLGGPTGQIQTSENIKGSDFFPTANTGSATSSSVTVRLTNSGFVPATVTVDTGDMVIWINETGNSMWVASAAHSVHSAYDNTSMTEHCDSTYTGAAPFDQCSTGNGYSFVFTRPGTWKYHNHSDKSQFGTVIMR